MMKMRKRRFDAVDAAVEHDVKPRMRALKPIDALVIERRNFAVFFRRQAFEPSFPACTMSASAPARCDGLRENFKRRFRILLVDADAAFDRDRDRNGCLHRRDAVADQRRLRHQASAEAAVLHAVGRAADIEIDLVKTQIGGRARASGKRARIGAAELQSQRMLGRIVAQEAAPDRHAAPRRW